MADQAVVDLLRIVEVVPLGSPDFQQALILGFSDFEDAVQAAAALAVGADWIVTRDARDFRKSGISPLAPAAAIAKL